MSCEDQNKWISKDGISDCDRQQKESDGQWGILISSILLVPLVPNYTECPVNNFSLSGKANVICKMY